MPVVASLSVWPGRLFADRVYKPAASKYIEAKASSRALNGDVERNQIDASTSSRDLSAKLCIFMPNLLHCACATSGRAGH